MTVFRPKLWTSLSAAALLTAGGLAACSGEGEGGEAGAAGAEATAGVGGEGEGGEGVAAGAPAAAGLGGEGEGGEGEGGAGEGGAGATGEAGAQGAYATVPAASRPALHLAHLKGFVLAAQAAAPTAGATAAAALVGQGLLEVYDPAKAAFEAAGVSEAALRKAAETGEARDLAAALANLNQSGVKAGGDPAAVVKAMTDIASGLYAGVLKDGAIDSVEYQHAYGAALAARAAAAQGGLTAVAPELDRFVKLWPAPVAPEDPAKLTPAGQVLAQASRVELAL